MDPDKQKASAYRSMRLAKEGKSKPVTAANRGDLLRWTQEKWVNLTAKYLGEGVYPCGTKSPTQKKLGLPTVCRPSVKKSQDTPVLAGQYSKKQIKKAIELKQKGQRIIWSKL